MNANLTANAEHEQSNAEFGIGGARKIVQIVESFTYGTAKSVKQLCSFFPNDQITVFYGERDGTDLELESLDPRIRWLRLPSSGPAKHLLNIRFVHRMIDRDTDIIHGHSTYGGCYAKALKILRPRTRVFYSPRGYSFLREDVPWPVRKLFWLFERCTARFCTTIACGPNETDIAKTLSKDVLRINNGMVIPSEPEFDYIGDEILTIGRISIQKGFDVFKEIASTLTDKRFVWIGSAEDSQKKLLKDLPANATVIPAMPHDELLKRIQAARFILLPSRWEGLSRVLLESICYGKALITSTCKSNKDCLTPKSGGDFQFENGFACARIEDYVKAITILDNEPALLKQMQVASYDLATEQFDLSKIRRQWTNLYQSQGQRVAAVKLGPQ